MDFLPDELVSDQLYEKHGAWELHRASKRLLGLWDPVAYASGRVGPVCAMWSAVVHGRWAAFRAVQKLHAALPMEDSAAGMAIAAIRVVADYGEDQVREREDGRRVVASLVRGRPCVAAEVIPVMLTSYLHGDALEILGSRAFEESPYRLADALSKAIVHRCSEDLVVKLLPHDGQAVPMDQRVALRAAWSKTIVHENRFAFRSLLKILLRWYDALGMWREMGFLACSIRAYDIDMFTDFRQVCEGEDAVVIDALLPVAVSSFAGCGDVVTTREVNLSRTLRAAISGSREDFFASLPGCDEVLSRTSISSFWKDCASRAVRGGDLSIVKECLQRAPGIVVEWFKLVRLIEDALACGHTGVASHLYNELLKPSFGVHEYWHQAMCVFIEQGAVDLIRALIESRTPQCPMLHSSVCCVMEQVSRGCIEDARLEKISKSVLLIVQLTGGDPSALFDGMNNFLQTLMMIRFEGSRDMDAWCRAAQRYFADHDDGLLELSEGFPAFKGFHSRSMIIFGELAQSVQHFRNILNPRTRDYVSFVYPDVAGPLYAHACAICCNSEWFDSMFRAPNSMSPGVAYQSVQGARRAVMTTRRHSQWATAPSFLVLPKDCCTHQRRAVESARAIIRCVARACSSSLVRDWCSSRLEGDWLVSRTADLKLWHGGVN